MGRITKDWVEAYYEYGIDPANRRIFLDGEIDADSASYIRRGILYMESESDDKPIELWVCSEGGDEYGMFSIYDVLRTVKCPIHTIATGLCMSAAPLLVAGGFKGERYATPNSWFMVHESWTDDGGPKRLTEKKREADHETEMTKRWAELMDRHTKLSAKQWLQKCNKVGDYFFDADKAVEYGLVDQLWSEKD